MMRTAELTESLRLMLITPDDPSLGIDEFVSYVDEAARCGVTAIMFREKRLADADFVLQARRVAQTARDRGAVFILNERVHLLEEVKPDMLHLTWRSILPDEWPSSVPIGCSTHSLDDVRGIGAHVDYLVHGPVFPTPSKDVLVAAQGLDGLRAACAVSRVPVVAIGGILPAAAVACFQAGAAGIAALSGLRRERADVYAAAVREES